jgi:sugar phosphate isomerase/epimerase
VKVGIFAKTFASANLEAALDAVRAHGLDCVQFNLACAGLPTLPDALESTVAQAVRQAMLARSIEMAAISGTFNMCHPEPRDREANLGRLRVLAAACGQLGTQVITLCTGTRDPRDMWCRHPDNDGREAWRDMANTVAKALQIAEDCDVTLAFEPEVSNVVDSARKGRRLLDEMRSPRLKVVMDPANLFHEGELARMPAIFAEAFELLAGDMILAHAKDLSHDGDAGHQAAGTGVLDYDLYLSLLGSAGYNGPLILHSLAEEQVAVAVAFLRGKLRSGPAVTGVGPSESGVGAFN